MEADNTTRKRELIVVTHWRVLKYFTKGDFVPGEVRKVNNLWLIRHPETSLNAGNCLRGHIDIGLNSKGIAQILDILAHLEGNDAVAVYSSDLSRASTVAERIADTWDLPRFLTSALRPADLGEMTGKPIVDMAHFLREIDAAGDAGQFPGGESIKQFTSRIFRVFNYLQGIN